MFNIISRLRPIVVDAFTFNEDVYNLCYPDSSSNFIPDWWRNLPATVPYTPLPQVGMATMKKCPGLTNIFKRGFIIPLWSDLAITLRNDGGYTSYNYQFSDNESIADTHPNSQFAGFYNVKEMQHLKLVTPWKLRESSGINFSMTQPVWNMQDYNKHITILPGITDFKYQDSVNIQMLINYPELNNKLELILPAGLPVCQLVPLTDRPVKIKRHLIDKIKYQAMGNRAFKFNGNYMFRKKLIDSNDSKCPFKKWI
jgi:hypothetical protein